ncbi:MFS transporter [Thermodesulfobacteriota bacterium]
MTIYPIVFFCLLVLISQQGNQILVSLFALELGADAFGVGVLISLYSVFPIFIAIYAGKVSDRFGARLPMLFGSQGLALGLLFPYLFPRLSMLYITAPIIGLAHTLFHVSYLHLIGYIDDADQRKRNFGILSLGGSIANFFGPLFTGFLIDNLGYISTYLCLLLNAIVSGFVLYFVSKRITTVSKESKGHHKRSLVDLIKNALLRRVLIISGVVVAGVHLYSFYLPVYGYTIGLPASSIGIILSAYAAATFVVRTIMSIRVKPYNEVTVLTLCLLIAGATFFMFPFSRNVLGLVLISFTLGVGLGCGQPLTIVMTYSRAPEGRSGEALGARITANRIAHTAVPLVFGFVGSNFGYTMVFWSITFFLIVSGCINMYSEKLKAIKAISVRES